jgi:hypothetical protein
MTPKEIRQCSRLARLMRLVTFAGINVGRAIYGERVGFRSVSHKTRRLSALVHTYAEEHARESIEHARRMVA